VSTVGRGRRAHHLAHVLVDGAFNRPLIWMNIFGCMKKKIETYIRQFVCMKDRICLRTAVGTTSAGISRSCATSSAATHCAPASVRRTITKVSEVSGLTAFTRLMARSYHGRKLFFFVTGVFKVRMRFRDSVSFDTISQDRCLSFSFPKKKKISLINDYMIVEDKNPILLEFG
jgi:hypothetical protein